MQQQDQPSNVGAETFKCKYCKVVVPDNWYYKHKHLEDAHGELSKLIKAMLRDGDAKAESCAKLAHEGMIGYADLPPIEYRTGFDGQLDDAANEFLQSNR